jgi:hypothetical protein
MRARAAWKIVASSICPRPRQLCGGSLPRQIFQGAENFVFIFCRRAVLTNPLRSNKDVRADFENLVNKVRMSVLNQSDECRNLCQIAGELFVIGKIVS